MEGKDGRRRLVQRTLFPHMEQSSTKEAENCDGDREEEVAEEEEWCPGSNKRGEGKKKGNSKTKKAPRAGSKKIIENGKETSSKQVDDSDPQVPVKSSFFVKYSEKQQQKRQQNQLAFIDSPEENDEICSPPSSVANGRSTPRKLKRQSNSTPRKERKNSTPNKKMKNGGRELCCGQIPSQFAMDEQPLRTIPNLRLEAKLTAEENSRIFAGRQIHPFFAACKGGKTSQDLTDMESKWSSFERKGKGITFNPIHVFENVEDDHTILDWGHWIFSERSAIGDLECGDSPVYERSVNSLNFDNFLNVPHFTRTSFYQNCQQGFATQEEVSTALPDRLESSHVISSASLDDERVICSEEQKDLAMLPIDIEDVLAPSLLPDHKTENNHLFAGTSCAESFNSGFQDELHQERIISHYHACYNQPENCLWTDKYRPQNAKQICGNGESVKLLSEWLQLWHRRGSLTTRSCTDEDNSIVQDTDQDYQQSDSDYDTTNDEENLKNVLLVTGPVGSGKSAAIYACARDQGFQIIEINASDWRNGALIKQKFGEAVESHWQRTVENEAHSDNKTISKFFKTVNAQTQCSENHVIELINLSDKEDFEEAGGWPKVSVSENRTANSQDEIKTLILFEDVDATLCEDHGFITTIQQLAETAKRPMILTSNSSNPVLPKNLDRLELSFSVPSVEELLRLVHMICASEKAKIHPCLVERFVDYCQQDIRKTIMLLQFWCQGQTLSRGNESHTTHWPVLFDLDAGHCILPKVIHWDYPSKLSELVAEEVFKSLILMEETCGLLCNKGDNRDGYSAEDIHVKDAEPNRFEAKKEAMLSMQGLLDEFECAQFEANSELCDFSCSPVAFAQEKHRRKKYAVVSSDSEDMFSGGSIPLVSAGVDINAEVLDMENVPISHCLSTDIYINAEVLGMKDIPISHNFSTKIHPTGSIYHSEVDRSEGHCQLQGGVDYFHTEDTCKSHDVSRVPESSFVPETEIISETELYSTTVSYGHFDNARGANILIQDQDSMPTLEPALRSQSEKTLHGLQKDQETLGNNSDTCTACIYQEEVGDSLSKSEPNVLRGYLDECSRVDFTWGLKSSDNTEADQATDFVKETWKRLHEQCNDLRLYVTTEEKTACQALTFAHGMSNLISEADLLLKDCQTLASDSLGSSMIPSENIHSCNYYDDQLEMSSILAQHGMCFYAKEIASLGPVMGSPNNLNLASEMLSSSSSSVALGKLASQDQRKFDGSDTKTNKNLNILTRKSDSGLSNILQTTVPSRSYLAAKGDAFHEYMSTLSQISRLETSSLCLSECVDNRKRRRARVSQRYLSSGSFALSSQQISLLNQYNNLPQCS